MDTWQVSSLLLLRIIGPMKWGGDSLRRVRFLEEVYRSIRKAVGNDYPVAIKLGIKDDTEEGLPVEEGAETAGRLARVGSMQSR